MQVLTTKHVWLITSSITAIACAIMACAIILFYPRDEWGWEFSLGLTLTIGMFVPVTYFMALKMREIGLLSDELRHLLHHDRLTDVATRDYFFAQMREAPKAEGMALMVDIDHFKQVNDTYGHFAGDAVIKAVASVMKENLPSKDFVCRFGGEEFILFLHERGHDDGMQTAEKLRSMVSDAAVMFGEQRITVTVSIGGAYKSAERSIDVAIREADAALYRAKNTGRDQTIFVAPRDNRAA